MDSAQYPPADNNQPVTPLNQPEIAVPPQAPEIQPPPTPPEIAPPPTPPEIPPPTSTSVASSDPPPSSKKFPFMLVTVIVTLVLAGFGGSFLFFQLTSPKKQADVAPLVTPPATIPPATPTTSANPFASPSAALVNPFISPTTAYTNPFGTGENPFAKATDSGTVDNQTYTNPFEQ